MNVDSVVRFYYLHEHMAALNCSSMILSIVYSRLSKKKKKILIRVSVFCNLGYSWEIIVLLKNDYKLSTLNNNRSNDNNENNINNNNNNNEAGGGNDDKYLD